MKKILAQVILLALPGPSVVAQPRESGNASTVGVYLETVTHDSAGNLWVGGSVWLLQGLLLRINSVGARVIMPPKIQTVQRLVFPDAHNAWMIADYRSLYRSTNGGNTWRKTLTTNSNLEDIAFVGHSGWVVGWHGTIYSTDNGGDTWNARTIGIDAELKRVVFADSLYGWAAGWDALLTTTDGGKTWKDITPKTLSLRGIAPVNRTHGWGIDADHNWTLIQTHDGGVTWQPLTNVAQTALADIFFANPNQGWAVGEAVIRTTDGGRTWQVQPLPKSGFTYSRVSFKGVLNGGAINIGAMHTNISGDIIRTGDGGRSWRVVPNTWVRPTTDKVYRAKFPGLRRSTW